MRAAFLDMGATMYGDCIHLDLDGFTILIDGGHPGDATGGADIPRQLKRLTGKTNTHVDLLVVTHSHDDHVGCLPRLVETGLLTAGFALVSAPEDRWSADDVDGAGLGELGQRLLDVLGEELPDPERDRPGFNAALDVARDLKTRYRAMIETLKAQGTKVVRYHRDAIKPVKDLLKNHGVTILGPTKKHLTLCTAALNEARDDVRRRIRDAVTLDASWSLSDLYLRVLGGGATDAPAGRDAASRSQGAINNLSIVLAVSMGGKKVLLPGDMQFADAQTEGLGAAMKALLKKVAAAGPYTAVKLPHHTSDNGWNLILHRGTLQAPLLIHTGGGQDSHHPDETVLAMLKQNRGTHTFLRTDRNGLITLKPGANGLTFQKARGTVDDFSPNRGADPGEVPSGPITTGVRTEIEPRITNSTDVVRITADIPRSVSKVVITVEIAAGAGSKATIGTIAPGLGGSKKKSVTDPEFAQELAARCEGLLLVTNEERLGRKLGGDAVNLLRGVVEQSGAGWIGTIPFPFSAENIQEQIAAALSQREYRGVVVLGDYDVTAPARFDCLPAVVRDNMSREVDDPDNFVVWSDGPYGDRDGDGVQEVPVSRVPDTGAPDFFWSCLARSYRPVEAGYMLRNVNRPFADAVHALLPAGARRFVSKPTHPGHVRPEQLREAHLYLMLHGSDYDAARFWGEEEDGHVEAINASVLPDTLAGVVFAGCCWGALIGREPAYRVVTDDPPLSRRIEDSMALSCLARGASAFVGCTGAHYSPVKKPYNYYGHPLHAAFWEAIQQGRPPAAALFAARQSYLENMPHPTPGDRRALDDLAIELKLYQQFTCLGFGW